MKNSPSLLLVVFVLLQMTLHRTSAQPTAAAAAAPPPPGRPNFIFIFADDLGLGDLASYGHPYAITPHLDRLATEGTSFYEFHNTGNVCPTSRAGFMTSRNPSWFPNYTEEYGFMGALTVTGLLHDAGYRVGHVGKWNIGPTPEGDSYEPYGIDDLRLFRGTAGDARGREVRRFDEAMAFVEEHEQLYNATTPFYLNIWVTAPHTPLDPPVELKEPFAELELDPSLFGRNMQHKLSELAQGGLDTTENMKNYLGVVSGLDLNIGRLLDKLDELQLVDNTIVVFTSDNGPAVSQTGSSGILKGSKHDYYEGGFVTPFIIRGPNIPAGKVNTKSLFSSLDWLPTVCTLAGADYPADSFEGEDVSDIWLGTSERSRTNPIFYRDLQRRATVAMRYRQWKLLDWLEELYDLEVDPEESLNVYQQYPDVVAAMLGSIQEWEATLPTVHARLPDEPYPFDPTECFVIGPPTALIPAEAVWNASATEVPSVMAIVDTPSPTSLPTVMPTPLSSLDSSRTQGRAPWSPLWTLFLVMFTVRP